ncbi:hypothetical protein QQS21_002346 [Conoideocrella luteorostrata]|uniref:Uncharacterized protein n=1 Tax=Conoideocrella luteorostrata TaxID=1105319 RepID=A0AAJ0CVC4_9HYPO|nr:hypothetical protein QQS21_002346 [Conoideocrella luteorostrata]
MNTVHIVPVMTPALQEEVDASRRSKKVQALIDLLSPMVDPENMNIKDGCDDHTVEDILSAIRDLLPNLHSDRTLFAAFHDGQVHNPLEGGAYAFENDIIRPLLLALINDENPTMSTSSGQRATTNPTRHIVVHAGAQPNNSPHTGTLVVFGLAFLLAQAIRRRIHDTLSENATMPLVSVEITLVDTAPVRNETCESNGVRYQHSYRDDPDALAVHMGDYDEVLDRMSRWSGILFRTNFQSDFFSHPSIPTLLSYIVCNRDRLAMQLSPKHNALALRAACPEPDCGLVEKSGSLNQYTDTSITFNCPFHGAHRVSFNKPSDVVRLEANTPMRNLIRSMIHVLDTSAHHVRITGADYAGTYQEALLYRPLVEWAGRTGFGVVRTPHILYAPLIVDWSGAKLSKSFYVRERGYSAMEILGLEGLCSYTGLKKKYGQEGLRLIWEEVEKWVLHPHMLFRASFSVEYFLRILNGAQLPS